MLEKIFQLEKNNTTVKTELVAGFTTFITMAYIIFVNPKLPKVMSDSPKYSSIDGFLLITLIAPPVEF